MLSPDNIDVNFKANYPELRWVLRKENEAVATPHPLSDDFAMTSQNLVCAICGRRANAKKQYWSIVVGPLAPFDGITRVLTVITMFLVLALITVEESLKSFQYFLHFSFRF